MKTFATLLCGSAMLLAADLANAQTDAPAPMAGMDHSAMAGMDHAEPMAAYMKAMDDMMSAMERTETTGDADVDYLLMMIPHHQSAVDMSEALLPYSQDPEAKALAEAVIAAQKQEIEAMHGMLARLGHPVE